MVQLLQYAGRPPYVDGKENRKSWGRNGHIIEREGSPVLNISSSLTTLLSGRLEEMGPYCMIENVWFSLAINQLRLV